VLRQVGRSPKFSNVLLRYEPEMEVGRSLHHRQVVDALDACGSLDRWDEPMEERTELATFGCCHLTEIQEMPPGFDDHCSCARFLQLRVLDEEVLAFDDVATWDGRAQQL